MIFRSFSIKEQHGEEISSQMYSIIFALTPKYMHSYLWTILNRVVILILLGTLHQFITISDPHQTLTSLD